MTSQFIQLRSFHDEPHTSHLRLQFEISGEIFEDHIFRSVMDGHHDPILGLALGLLFQYLLTFLRVCLVCHTFGPQTSRPGVTVNPASLNDTFLFSIS